MFRLIKLGLYCMVGYFIYEMYVGMTAQPADAPQPRRKSGGRQPSRRNSSNLTGGGRGRKVQTEDADGASETHVVGCGVIS